MSSIYQSSVPRRCPSISWENKEKKWDNISDHLLLLASDVQCVKKFGKALIEYKFPAAHPSHRHLCQHAIPSNP